MKHWKILATAGFVLLLLAAGKPLQAQSQRRPNQQRDGERDTRSRITLHPGTTISVRVADEVNSTHNHVDDVVIGTVDPSVFIDNRVVIPRGTEAHLQVVEARKGGRLHGKAAISLELIGLVINKEKLNIDSNDFRKKQGALSAKLKGAGAASAAAGTTVMLSPNPASRIFGPVYAIFRRAKVQVPPGTRIKFSLATPFTFEEPIDSLAQREFVQR